MSATATAVAVAAAGTASWTMDHGLTGRDPMNPAKAGGQAHKPCFSAAHARQQVLLGYSSWGLFRRWHSHSSLRSTKLKRCEPNSAASSKGMLKESSYISEVSVMPVDQAVLLSAKARSTAQWACNDQAMLQRGAHSRMMTP